MDEVAIWNTALSTGQIKTLYNNREPFNAKNIAFSNLKGYWRMGDGVLDHRQTNGLVADQVNATLGSEELGTADNDWNVTSAYWSISSGVLTFNGETNGNATHVGTTIGAYTFTTGTTYKLQLTIANSGGSAKFIIQDSDDNKIIANATYSDGLYTFYFIATSDNNGEELEIRGVSSGGSSFDITSYSLKEISGNAGVMVNFDGTDFKTDTH